MADITINRGDDYVYDGTATLSGSAVNLTGCSLWFTVKYNAADADAAALFQRSIGTGIAIVSAAAGTFTVSIVPSNTSGLTRKFVGVYDCQLVDATGKVYTVASGNFTVNLDVTVTTA